MIVFRQMVKENQLTYIYDEQWAEDHSLTEEEITRLGTACTNGFIAEMSDSYRQTINEQTQIGRNIKDLLDRYNLIYYGTSISYKG